MKKMIFLLLMAFAIVGFISAFDDTAHPPGGITLDVEKIACISAAYGCLVHQVTVLAEYTEAVSTQQPAGEYALLSATIEPPFNLWEQAAWETAICKETFDTGQKMVDYWLRL